MKDLLSFSCIHRLVALTALVVFPAFAFAQMGPRMMSPSMAPAMSNVPRGSMMPQMGSAMPQMGSGMSQMSSGMPQMSYGGAYSTVQGYTNGYDSGTGAYAGSQGYAAESQPSPEEKRVSRLLTATGVPNDNGRLRWPLGLRVLAAPQADELRDQLDALFQESAIQAASGPVNATLAQETQRAVKRFRGLVLKDKAERFGLALAVYDESERFLTRLERAEQVLQAGLNAPGQSQQTTRALSTSDSSAAGAAEVGLSDNSFEPNVLTVPVGTTVRWTNHGHHRHTVTADDGRWDSKEVPGQGVFTYTFTQPGTFPYHCAVHPQEMRGTVVVK